MSSSPPPPTPAVPNTGLTGMVLIGLVVGGRQALKAIIDPFEECVSTGCVIDTLFEMEEVVFTGFLACIGLLALPLGVLIWSARKRWKRWKASSTTGIENSADDDS